MSSDASRSASAQTPGSSSSSVSGSVGATGSTGTTASTSTDATTSTSRSASADVAAASGSAEIGTRITEWRLAPTEIQADLDRGVTIVRTRDSVVGAPTGNTDDAVLLTLVKGKLQADSQVSAIASKIEVEAKSGEITLKGSAPSADLVGRAVALALNTDGVTKVSSELKVDKASK